MTSKRTQELIKWDKEHLIHPIAPVGQEPAVIWEKAHGIMIQDTEGREYIDVSSQLINVNLGHSRQEIIDAAIEQISKLQFAAPFWGRSNTAMIECSQKLVQILPEGLNHILFAAGGSEANEYALKIARLYWRNKGKNKFKIISLFQSYHGLSYGILSATALGKGSLWAGYTPLVPGFIHIPSYYCYRCSFGKEYPDCGMQCAKFLAETIENQGGDVAAFIAEPEIGAGGFISPPPEYWPVVRQICTDHDVLLIADEVMTGFCRTGKMFALENWDVVPDIMTMSKGINSAYLPFGAVAISDGVCEGIEGSTMSGFSSCGNPVCSAAASAAIDIYTKERVAEHVAEVGKHVMERLNAEFLPLPCVGNISGLGLMLGVELVTDKAIKGRFDPAVMTKLQAQALEKGLLVRVGGFPPCWLAICPPLIITIEETDRILDILYPLLAELKPS